MFRSVAVLLVVSSMAVLVQSSGGPSDAFGQIEHLRNFCINYMAEEFRKIPIDPNMEQMITTSRVHHEYSLEKLIRKELSPGYEKVLWNLEFPEQCATFWGHFVEVFFGNECVQFIEEGQENSNTFWLEVANSDEEARTRVEIISTCEHAAKNPHLKTKLVTQRFRSEIIRTLSR